MRIWWLQLMLNNEMERKVKGTRRGMRYDCKGKWDTAPQTGREGIGNYVW